MVASALPRSTVSALPDRSIRLVRNARLLPGALVRKPDVLPLGVKERGGKGVRGKGGVQPPLSPASARMQRRAFRRDLQAPEPSPEVRKLDRPVCKPRPADNAPKGGGGSGRPRRFVPWCS